MKSEVLISLLALFLSNFAFAYRMSGGVGNGGDVIVCPERAESVILLDSYEARKRQLTLDLIGNSQRKPSWRSMVQVAVDRLMVRDTQTATLLKDYAMEMVTDFENYKKFPGKRGKVVHLGNDVNVRIDDSLHVSLPADCEQEPKQLVNQSVPQGRFDFRYHFNKSLWDKMSLLEQSMTILHEAWYRIMIENGAVNSRATRYMNGLVASQEFEILSFSEYLEELKGTELKEYIVVTNSEAIRDSYVRFDLKKHTLNSEGEEVCAPNFKLNASIKKRWRPLNRSQKYFKNAVYQKVCFKDSQLSRLVLTKKLANSDIAIRLPFYQIYILEGSATKEPTMHFHANGKLSHISGMKADEFMEMFYTCNGKISYTMRFNCERGPEINHDTKIIGTSEVRFDTYEKPLDHFKR